MRFISLNSRVILKMFWLFFGCIKVWIYFIIFLHCSIFWRKSIFWSIGDVVPNTNFGKLRWEVLWGWKNHNSKILQYQGSIKQSMLHIVLGIFNMWILKTLTMEGTIFGILAHSVLCDGLVYNLVFWSTTSTIYLCNMYRRRIFS